MELADLFENPDFHRFWGIRLPSNLKNKFLEIQDASEETGYEHGCSLYYDPTLRSIIARHEYKSESPSAVNLKNKDHSKTKYYCGDFHTHPFKKKVGDGVSVGPSGTEGDWKEWFCHPPREKNDQNSNINGIHFVASGKLLYLIVIPYTSTQTHEYDDLQCDIPDGWGASLTDDQQMKFADAEQCIKHKQYDKAIEHSKNGNLAVAGKDVFLRISKMNARLADKYGCKYLIGVLQQGIECDLTICWHS
ncbi:MAG: hypothetical protein U1E41_14055 [Paracoccus sp. (in: a-proteobacteria)]|jgi:hypothetical protein